MGKLIGEYIVVALTNLGDKFNDLEIRPADKIWTVPYLRYSYRSTYMAETLKKDVWFKNEELLEPGNYELIGISSEITEEQAQGIVESDWWHDGPQEEHGLGKVTYYRDYPNELEDSCELSAIISFKSLLTSKGLKGRYAILKTIK